MASCPSDITADQELALLIPPDVPRDMQPDRGRELVYSGEIFGTTWSVTLLRRAHTSPASDEAYRAKLVTACRQTLALIDDQMSLWREGSIINRYNALAHGESLELPQPMANVVAMALGLFEETRGAFYPGLYHAVERWGFGARAIDDPVASGLDLAKRHPRCLPQCPGLRAEALEKRNGFALDLNAIAKGYAVDLLCDVVRSHPETAACLVEIGGELKGYGTRADGMPFWTNLAPGGEGPSLVYRAALYGWACATSGEAERRHAVLGDVYSHILDPQTLASAKTDLVAATVFDKQCARADALATALMVMGAKQALAFANEHEVPCVLTPRDGSQDRLSDPMRAWL